MASGDRAAARPARRRLHRRLDLQTSLKLLVHRPRPPATLAPAYLSSYAFPSGHATDSAAVYGMLADLTLRPTSHTPKIARAAQPNRCALGQDGAVNSAATKGTPRKRARPSPASSNTPRLFQMKIGRASGASRFIHGLVVRTSQW